MAKWIKAAVIVAGGMVLPEIVWAQGVASQMNSLHNVLDHLYAEMMPLCSKLIGVGQGIAGFAATWYIASRVWRHIANAEPIDFYPLFRPFVIGFAIIMFPSVIGLINGVMQPTVAATGGMVEGTDKAIAMLLKQKEEAIRKTDAWQMYTGESGSGDRDKWYKYTHDNSNPTDEGVLEGIGNDIQFAMSKASYNFRNSIKEWMSEVLRLLFEAAALCINTLRTFQLIVLAILGPLVFGLSVFDGFHHSLTVWIARYINIFLWLPIANIFGSIIGKIQEKMLVADISQVQNFGDTFFSSTDTAYLVFLIIGIVGSFTVPSVANYIINAGGGSAMVHKVTTLFSTTSSNAVYSASGAAAIAADAMGTAAQRVTGNMTNSGVTSGYFRDGDTTPKHGYMQDKIAGNK